MRHRIKGTKLGRDIKSRKALFKNLAISLVLEERIKTSLPKAKNAKAFVDSLVSKAKKRDLSSRRLVLKKLGNQKAVAKLFDILTPRFSDRVGGFTRIIKLGNRSSDTSPMAILEFVKIEKKSPKEIKKEEKEKIREKKAKRKVKKAKKVKPVEKKDLPAGKTREKVIKKTPVKKVKK
jgi:large subunit ribosomal protein L17